MNGQAADPKVQAALDRLPDLLRRWDTRESVGLEIGQALDPDGNWGTVRALLSNGAKLAGLSVALEKAWLELESAAEQHQCASCRKGADAASIALAAAKTDLRK